MSFNENILTRTYLITGGTGSFGKTMVKFLLAQGAGEIRILSRDEAKQEFMRIDLSDDRLKFYIGDVRDYNSVNVAMKGVDYVFHAAALKQVPSCEFFPMQAVMTNVEGSNNVIKSAVDHKVKSVVCLSTDKAVYPVNAMGMTKALMEKAAQSYSRNLSDDETTVSCVRYGNVMYSRGSVIPLFIKCIKEGSPLTLTSPKMTRFLMSLPQSVDLVKYAFEYANQGDIFIRKAPACNVEDLATALCQLFEVEADIRIIGVRHGEKMYEALASAEELARSENHSDYYQISMDARDLNYKKYFTEGDVNISQEDYTSDNTQQLNVQQVKELLMTLPEVRQEVSDFKTR